VGTTARGARSPLVIERGRGGDKIPLLANPGAPTDHLLRSPRPFLFDLRPRVTSSTEPLDEGEIEVPVASGHDESDLGFGRVVSQNNRGRFLSREGRPSSRKYGLGNQWAERFYLRALNARWPEFLTWVVGGILLVNGVFALLFRALGESAIVGGAEMGLDDPFLRALAFSVGVFTTAGTGTMHAVGTTATWLLILEAIAGPITLVAVGGLLIARLTRPRTSIRFSESAVIAPYEGGRAFMFRIANASPGELSDVRARVNLIWFEEVDGKRERDFVELALERTAVEFFTLHWTVVHPITADSPLAGVTPAKLAAAEAEFVISLSAHEETFATRVTRRASYTWDEVRWDVKFSNIYAAAPAGVIAIDVDRLSRTDPLPEGATSQPAELESLPRGPRAV
jgi:inward rectifier potassium channel